MKGLDQEINERVSFLKEQINPQNKPLVNQAFEIQIETLRNTDYRERVALVILQKKKQLENAKDTASIERLYTELEALEWLQRQVVKHNWTAVRNAARSWVLLVEEAIRWSVGDVWSFPRNSRGALLLTHEGFGVHLLKVENAL